MISANIADATGPLSAGVAKARTVTQRQTDADYSAYTVSRGHFRTLGIPLLAGRDFSEEDREGAPKVGVVNEALAQRYWPGESPIGKHLAGVEVIGLVRNTKYLDNADPPKQFLYVSILQNYTPEAMLLVKGAADGAAIVSAVREAVATVDADIPISNIMAIDDVVNMSLLPMRTVGTLAGVLGILALGS